MFNVEDNINNRTWWYEQLNLSDDWNSMPIEMRNDLVKKLQRALLDLTKLNISKDEMTELVVSHDVPTVWDAMLALQDLSAKENKSHWELLAYLKKTCTGMWKVQHPSRLPIWQKLPTKEEKVKESPPASWETVERNDPINFNKRYCRVCKRKLRSNNKTGICSHCQKHGKGTSIDG